jgi:hypothetical protein
MVRLKSGMLVLAYNPGALGKHGTLTTDVLNIEGVADRFSEKRTHLQSAGDTELRRMMKNKPADTDFHSNGLLAWGPRTPLCLGISSDDGNSWKIAKVLEDNPGEYSYPSIIQSSDDTIHIVYTYKRTRIKHICLSENELLN